MINYSTTQYKFVYVITELGKYKYTVFTLLNWNSRVKCDVVESCSNGTNCGHDLFLHVRICTAKKFQLMRNVFLFIASDLIFEGAEL